MRPMTVPSKRVEPRKTTASQVVIFVRTLTADVPKMLSVTPPLTAPRPPPDFDCWIMMTQMSRMLLITAIVPRR